ncbi:hypothetical protein Barb7_00025 [Bacteroidales bacterium Barb7]|nr:hypothetical protein Barb7_00078 [Bacteroidales bacterium Barb7]OAV76311.1 hypothetical protein Barb7_00025 [Bacteroidales bacterium Barb7]
MNKENLINKFIKLKGYDLREIEGCDLSDPSVVKRGLTKQEAIDVLKYSEQIEVAILGGDVYFLDHNGNIDMTHDNWYSDKRDDETTEEYIRRSINESKKYIGKYKNNSYKDFIILFEFVFGYS